MRWQAVNVAGIVLTDLFLIRQAPHGVYAIYSEISYG